MAGRAALRLLRPVVERFEAEDGLWLGERTLALVRPVVDQNDAIDRAPAEPPLDPGARPPEGRQSSFRRARRPRWAHPALCRHVEELRAWKALPAAA